MKHPELRGFHSFHSFESDFKWFQSPGIEETIKRVTCVVMFPKCLKTGCCLLVLTIIVWGNMCELSHDPGPWLVRFICYDFPLYWVLNSCGPKVVCLYINVTQFLGIWQLRYLKKVRRMIHFSHDFFMFSSCLPIRNGHERVHAGRPTSRKRAQLSSAELLLCPRLLAQSSLGHQWKSITGWVL